MANNKKITSQYVYGNVAYDIEPKVSPRIDRNPKPARKNKNKAMLKLKLVGKVGVVFLLAFLLVARFTVIMKLTYDIRNTKAEITQTVNNNEDIRIELAKTDNIKNIEKTAVDKFGMVVPDSSHVLYVSVKPLTISSEKASTSAFNMIQRLLGLIN